MTRPVVPPALPSQDAVGRGAPRADKPILAPLSTQAGIGPPADDGKRHTRGTHRARRPEETLAWLTPRLTDFGITRVAVLTGLDRIGLPVVSVCRPNARSSAVFHGKGLDLVAAKVSGLMEAVETWHAETATPPVLFGSRLDLDGTHRLIHTDGLPRRTATALPVDRPLLWTEADDLAAGDRIWVPFETVHADYRIDGPPASGCLAMTTNGLASGNTYWEAATHALCELIERDATTMWRSSSPAQRQAMRLGLDSVTDPDCRAVLDRLSGAGMGVAVWDVTTEIGIPAFQCLIADIGSDAGPTGVGAGCHPVPGIALARALTEAAQVRMTYIAGAREDLLPDDYTRDTRTRRHRAAVATIGGGPGVRAFAADAGFAEPTFAAEAAAIVGRLGRAGFGQVAVVDLSRAGLAVAVVRAVVPGLEGSDHAPGFVPGRRAQARGGA